MPTTAVRYLLTKFIGNSERRQQCVVSSTTSGARRGQAGTLTILSPFDSGANPKSRNAIKASSPPQRDIFNQLNGANRIPVLIAGGNGAADCLRASKIGSRGPEAIQFQVNFLAGG